MYIFNILDLSNGSDYNIDNIKVYKFNVVVVNLLLKKAALRENIIKLNFIVNFKDNP